MSSDRYDLGIHKVGSDGRLCGGRRRRHGSGCRRKRCGFDFGGRAEVLGAGLEMTFGSGEGFGEILANGFGGEAGPGGKEILFNRLRPG